VDCCSNNESEYQGKTVKEIPELSGKLVELATDFKNWITTFKCTKCGQMWIEKYTSKGHGDIATVYKSSNSVNNT